MWHKFSRDPCCIYQCKDTNFKANHNQETRRELEAEVVFTNAKILILKLITTRSFNVAEKTCCIYQCKDTNFKANHNCPHLTYITYSVVFTNAKILILKLITTNREKYAQWKRLYLPMQRY